MVRLERLHRLDFVLSKKTTAKIHDLSDHGNMTESIGIPFLLGFVHIALDYREIGAGFESEVIINQQANLP